MAPPRRAYTSRAFCSACSASTACRDPACSCGAPCALCVNTSQSGHCASPGIVAAWSAANWLPTVLATLRRLGCLLRPLLLGVHAGGLAHPCPLVVRLAPRVEPLA